MLPKPGVLVNIAVFKGVHASRVSQGEEKNLVSKGLLPSLSPTSLAADLNEINVRETFSTIDNFRTTAPTSLNFKLSNHVPHGSGLFCPGWRLC